jgi:Zn-dependent M16 (insulinase) family peptidase
MLEGCLWKRIRGAGLAYGAGISSDFSRGHITFRVYRSPNGYNAWQEAQKIVSELSAGEVQMLCYFGLMEDYD